MWSTPIFLSNLHIPSLAVHSRISVARAQPSEDCREHRASSRRPPQSPDVPEDELSTRLGLGKWSRGGKRRKSALGAYGDTPEHSRASGIAIAIDMAILPSAQGAQASSRFLFTILLLSSTKSNETKPNLNSQNLNSNRIPNPNVMGCRSTPLAMPGQHTLWTRSHLD